MRGLFVGAVAGAAASFAMDRFQALTKPLLPSSGGGNGGGGGGGEGQEPATEQAADAVARRVVGRDVPDIDKPAAGQVVHYALGIALGATYGIAAEFYPKATAGLGGAFGLVTATVLDQGVVPAVGLGDPPWKADTATTGYSYASHLVFGGTAEIVRRAVRRALV